MNELFEVPVSDMGATGLVDSCILKKTVDEFDSALKAAIKVLRKRGGSKEQIENFKTLAVKSRHSCAALAAAEQRAGIRPEFKPSEAVYLANPLHYTIAAYSEVLDLSNHAHVAQWGEEVIREHQEFAESCGSIAVQVWATTDIQDRRFGRLGEGVRIAVCQKSGLLANPIQWGRR